MASDMTPSPWSMAEIVASTRPADDREWVPSAFPGVWMRPLLFDTAHGAWVNIVRMDTEGVVSRHRHPAPVHGFTIAGNWRYAERDWIAGPGDYVYEPAGDIHTLIAMPGESRTLFWISGALIEVDADGNVLGQADVFTRIEQAAQHFASVGLGRDHVRQYIR
jgi:2,4'-dihydroxyacetophenone dioxygenase